VRKSTEKTKKAEASAILAGWLKEAADGQFVRSPDEVTWPRLGRLIRDDYEAKGNKSTARLKASLKHLEGFYADFVAEDITGSSAKRYRLHRLRQGAAEATIQAELAALRRMLKLAVEDESIPYHTAPVIPRRTVKNARRGFFHEEDVRRLAPHLPAYLRPVVWFAFYTGWRKSEILGLQWGHVDREGEVLYLYDTKNDEPRTFPYGALPQLRELIEAQRLQAMKDGRICPWVFHRDGRQIGDFRKVWRAGLKAVDMEGRWFHDLRRSAIRNFERAGVSRSTAMKLSGHKTASVYERYAISDSQAKLEAVEKIAGLFSTKTQEETDTA
jgi:integrase